MESLMGDMSVYPSGGQKEPPTEGRSAYSSERQTDGRSGCESG